MIINPPISITVTACTKAREEENEEIEQGV